MIDLHTYAKLPPARIHDLQHRITAEGRLRVFRRGTKVTLALCNFDAPCSNSISTQTGVRKYATWNAAGHSLTAHQQAAFEELEPATPNLFHYLNLTEEF
jgi:hypothetical protein